MTRQRIFFLIGSTLLLLACSLITPPPAPVIPTPPPTAVPIRDITGEVIVDPVSAGIRLTDPIIEDLVNRQISQQNLFAYVNTLAGFGTRHSLSETQLGDFGVGAARRWIHDELVRVGGGRLQVSYDDFRLNYIGLTTQQRNVVATLPGTGTQPGSLLLVAHYDSRAAEPTDGQTLAPGANDNASGVALMIEVARLMSAQQWSQTVIFVAFAAEEQGTHGSKHFVQNNILDGAQFDVVINNDIVGGRPGIPQAIRVFALPDDMSNSRQLARYMEYMGNAYLPNFSVAIQGQLDRSDEFGQRYSDHREFINAGVAAVRVTESVEDLTVQHTSLDTADLIDYNYLRQSTQLSLANASKFSRRSTPTYATYCNKYG